MTVPISQKSRAGFTLLELAIVLGIVMLVLVATIRFAVPLIENARQLETKEKMAKIAEALALYALENNRVPCPALPSRITINPSANGFGYEQNNGSSVNSDDVLIRAASRCGDPSATTAWRGIVPFKTLGIQETNVKDAWGNYFTYAVSPAFTLPAAAALEGVQARCRTRDWLYLGSDLNYHSRNPAKAGFCCPGKIYNTATDLQIIDDRNGAANNVLYRTRSAGNSFNADTPFTDPSTYLTADQTPVAVPYVLISHGPNGGAVAFNVSTAAGTRFGTAPAANTCEVENSNDSISGDRIYRDCRPSENTAYNDDITYWQTQDLMLAGLGESCASP